MNRPVGALALAILAFLQGVYQLYVVLIYLGVTSFNFVGNAVTEDPAEVYFKQASQEHRNYIREEKCPTCLSPCQMNVAAIKQVVPYAKFLVRASAEKRRAARQPIVAAAL